MYITKISDFLANYKNYEIKDFIQILEHSNTKKFDKSKFEKVFLQNDRGETLILKTPETSTYKGKYDLPGGRIDQDEFYTDLLEILDREIKEEVGEIKYEIKNKPVAVSRHKAVHRSHVEDIFYCFYEAKIVSGQVNISNEHSDFDWIKLDEVELQDYFISGILDGVKMYLSK